MVIAGFGVDKERLPFIDYEDKEIPVSITAAGALKG